jgi:hypothetical protein
MAADIINLRQARKRKAREDRQAEAEQNRQLHGETKASKSLRKRKADKAATDLAAHRRDNPDPDPVEPE